MDKILWKGKDVLKITNGHGPSNWNASGVGYIYFAFAEHPFVTEGTKAAGTAR